MKTKPAILILCTHELAWPALIYKLLFNCRMIYDIRENYRLNLSASSHYSPLLLKYLRLQVILKENLLFRFSDRLLLAEKIYAQQLPLPESKILLLENRAPDISPSHPRDEKHLIFTGTIAPHTGIYECLELFAQLNGWQLTIAGYCSLPEWRTAILEKIRLSGMNRESISLEGFDQPCPHSRIIELISTATAGFIHYRDVPQVRGKMPTKLFEYLGGRLPVIFREESDWYSFATEFQEPILLRPPYTANQVQQALATIETGLPQPPEKLYWKSQEPQLLKALMELQ